jgi:hypothetical protein
MKLIKNRKFIGILSVVATLSIFDLLIANSSSFRFWLQSHLWRAPDELKVLVSTEIGEPYTILRVKDVGELSKIDEFKALKFWITFEVGDAFIAVSQTEEATKAISFISLNGVLGSYYRNLLKYESPVIKEMCLLGLPTEQISINGSELKESFLIIDGQYVFEVEELKSVRNHLIEGKCE